MALKRSRWIFGIFISKWMMKVISLWHENGDKSGGGCVYFRVCQSRLWAHIHKYLACHLECGRARAFVFGRVNDYLIDMRLTHSLFLVFIKLTKPHNYILFPWNTNLCRQIKSNSNWIPSFFCCCFERFITWIGVFCSYALSLIRTVKRGLSI